MIRQLAGIHAPAGGADTGRLARVLGPDAATIARGPLAVAFTGGPPPAVAHQPLCLLDGRLHNAAALAAQLGLPSGSSDEQLVGAAWRSTKSELPAGLRGGFALLVWDADHECGLLARDQLGVRPLFVHETGGVLRFASEVRLLLAMLATRPAPDQIAVVNWLARGAAGRGRTLYEGIRPLGPGRLIKLQRDGRSERRYWNPALLPPLRISREQAVHEVARAIEKAVSVRTGGHSNLAAEVSGGIDSASVAAFTARLRADGGPSLCAYSAVFPRHPRADEEGFIDLLVRSLAVPSVRMTVDSGAALAPGLRFMQRWELPLGPGNHFVWEQLLQREAADGMEISLNGQGGDELFGAPVYLLADRIARARVLAAYRLSGAIPGMGAHPARGIRRRAVKLWGVRGALPHGVHRAAWRRRAAERHTSPLLSPESARILADSHDPYPWKAGPGPRWRAERLDLLTDGADGMGVSDYLRRRAADAGIQSKEPFLDVGLVELMLRLPPELSFDPDLSRPLLREAAGRLLPDPIRLRREKSAFDAILTDALRGPDLLALRRILGRTRAEVTAWTRPGLLREILDDAPEANPGGAHGWSKAAWRLAGLELWLRAQDDPSFTSCALDQMDLAEPRCSFRVVGGGVHA